MSMASGQKKSAKPLTQSKKVKNVGGKCPGPKRS
jgi:hypothetical protein